MANNDLSPLNSIGSGVIGQNAPNNNNTTGLNSSQIDWFSSLHSGTATPISVQNDYSTGTSIDDIVNDVLSHLGVS